MLTSVHVIFEQLTRTSAADFVLTTVAVELPLLKSVRSAILDLYLLRPLQPLPQLPALTLQQLPMQLSQQLLILRLLLLPLMLPRLSASLLPQPIPLFTRNRLSSRTLNNHHLDHAL